MSDDLVEWLRAQLAIDEERAQAAADAFLHGDRTGLGQLHPSLTRHVYNWTSARVLREVEAKRKILDRYERARTFAAGPFVEWFDKLASDHVVRELRGDVFDLAEVYFDRPGFRKEWR